MLLWVTQSLLQQAQKQDLQNYLDKAKIKALFAAYKEESKSNPQDSAATPLPSGGAGGGVIDPCRKLSYEECCKLYPERCDIDPKIEKIYYFHPDHLGTTTFLTDANGDSYQFFLNLLFGETMAEQKSWTQNYATPYKFTGK